MGAVAESLQVYFEIRNNCPPLWLHAMPRRIGMLLQRLPGRAAKAAAGAVDIAEVDDAWRRVQLIAKL